MGDHRAIVRMGFEMHGHKAETELNINWTPSGYDYDIDRRVDEWFAAQAKIARAKWNAEQWDAGNEQDTETAERGGLARLKTKYENLGDKGQ